MTTINPAVRQALEARIEKLDAEIHSATEILTSYVTHMNEAKAAMDTWTNKLHVLETERAELVEALPAAEEPEPEQPTDPEPVETEDEEG